MKTCKRCKKLEDVISSIHWMARRYSDNRCSYATSLFNEEIRKLLKLDVHLNLNDGIIWARDAYGRNYDRLTDQESTIGTLEALGGKSSALETKKIRKRLQSSHKIR